MINNLYKTRPQVFVRNSLRALSLLVIFSALLSSGVAEAASETRAYTVVGGTTWTAPAGVSTTSAEAWGGGGGGAGGANGSCCGGGGGGGAYARSQVSVTAGNSYMLVVGAAGLAGASGANPGGNGTSSMFFSSTTVFATGGGGGAAGATGAGGATTTGSVGTTTFQGGNGSAGVSTASGGAGGGGAGSSANGTNAVTTTAGTGGATGGGSGGAGLTTAGIGNVGNTFGGGGGAAIRTGASQAGGAGAQGQVKLTYNLYTVSANTADPANSTIAPGAATTSVDNFTLQTGTTSDSITSITVRLGTNAYQGIFGVEIWDSADTVAYGSSYNPASDIVTIATMGLTANTSLTTYHLRIKPLSHANMPPVPGASYVVTASTTVMTSTGITAGTSTSMSTDVSGATITIDNLSPGVVTGATASGADTQVSLAWTNPGDADLASIVVLRAAATVIDVPVEGTSYSVGNIIGAATVACVTGVATLCNDSSVSNGTAYYYKIFTKDSSGNYSSTGVVPSGSPVTPIGPILTQRAYVFTNDNLGNVSSSTNSHSSATSTAIINVKKGERMVVRMQVDNTSNASSTAATWKLQWENNTDAAGTWNDISTTTAISWSLSDKGAIRGSSGVVPLPFSQVTTCTGGTTYTSGEFIAGTATSSAFSLGLQCTELAYAIQTASSSAGKTYRLRLVTGTSGTTLNTYATYPTFTIESTQNIRYSREVRGGVATSTLTRAGAVGDNTSIAIGSDGFPVISYYEGDSKDLDFIKCNNIVCSLYATSTLDSPGDVGGYSSIAIGKDGFPVISYVDNLYGYLKFAKCNNISCTSVATSSLDTNSHMQNTSIAIGSDGFPVISYFDFYANKLDFAKCNNISCSSYATSTLDTGTGAYSSITIGFDGLPVIAYGDLLSSIVFAKCNNISCSSKTISRYSTASGNAQYVSIAIGSDGFPVAAYYDAGFTAGYFIKCTNSSCSSANAVILIASYLQYNSLAIGTDGNPTISAYDSSALNLITTKCYDIACNTTQLTRLDTSSAGSYASLAIGSDGFPVISYLGASINFARCSSIDCKIASSTANLPTTNLDLDSYLDDAGYNNAATVDGVSDTLMVASSSRGAYLFTKKYIATTTQAINVVWTGQESVATTTYLKIYNQSTAQWEVLGSSTTQSNATTFSITGIQSTNLKNYYDTTGLLSLRLETGTTTHPLVLSTDAIAISLVALGTTTQRAYVFMNDDLGNVASSTRSHSGATSTPITLVKKGEKLIALIQIDNSAVQTSATTTRAYRLQWENNTDAPNTWTDVGTGGDIRWSYSDKGALTARYGQVPLNIKQVATCNASAPMYTSGRFVAATNQSTIFALGPQQCSELGFAIQTSAATLGKTYRLRLIDGTANQLLDAYVAYPTMTIEATQNIRYSREVRGGVGTSSIDYDLAGNGNSIAIGIDGFPIIAHTSGVLVVGKCFSITCSQYSSSTSNTTAVYTSIAVGTDGYPVIAYNDNTNLWVAKCNNISCSSMVNTLIDTATFSSGYVSLVIGPQGFPMMLYQNSDGTKGFVMLATCSDVACSAFTLRQIAQRTGTGFGVNTLMVIGADGFPAIAFSAGTTGLFFGKCADLACNTFASTSIDARASTNGTSLAIGLDGNPMITYYDPINLDLDFAKCANISCTVFATSSLDQGGDVGSDASIAVGSDGMPIISYYDNTNNNLNFLKCNNSSCTSLATSSLDQGGIVGIKSSLAVGVDGFPVITYKDNANIIDFARCSNNNCSQASSVSANLPTTPTDLDSYLDDTGYTNVATNDSIYDAISGATSTQLAYVFSKHDTVNTDQITGTWIGQVSLATSTYLQVYDNTLAKWIGFATNTTPTANTNFTLTTTLSSNLSAYYDSSFNVAVRVVTGTTTSATTLKTDQITITLGAAGSANQTLIHYRWRNDDGTEVAATYAAPEDAPMAATSSMYKGDRRRLRLTVSNAGSADATNITYRLEYASSSCTSWLPVPSYNTQTTEEWVTDLSGYLPEGAITTHSSGMSVPPGKTFTSGEARVFTNQTGSITLTTAQSTELEYGIRSTTFAQSNLLYCFRLTNAGSVTNFTYAAQPQATLNPNPRPQSGGTGSDSTGLGTPRAGGGQGGGAPVDPPAVGVPVAGGGQGGGGGDSG